MGVSKAVLEIVEIEECGETAVEINRYTMFDPDDKVLDKGKYIVIWQQVNNQWKLHRDIFNSSVPLPG